MTIKALTYDIDFTNPDPNEQFKVEHHPTRSCKQSDTELIQDPTFNEIISLSQCLDDVASLKVKGNFESGPSSSFGIQLHKCAGSPNCKSEAEIRSFINNITIGVFYNSEDFSVNKFGERSEIIKTSVLSDY